MNDLNDVTLREARVHKGYTIAALAEKLGISEQTLIEWESGEVEIKPFGLYALAYVFQVDADCLRIPTGSTGYERNVLTWA